MASITRHETTANRPNLRQRILRAMAPGRPDATSSDPKRWPVRRAEPFGGVVVRSDEEGLSVAMIRTRNLKGDAVWTLPKGTPDEGETPEETAVREVREETGLEVRLL